MSTPVTPATPAVATAAVVAPKLNAIQLVEAELQNFVKQAELAAKQAEQAVANVHAVQGAIQGAQRLLNILKTEAAKGEAEAKKLAEDVVTEVEKGIHVVEAEAKKL